MHATEERYAYILLVNPTEREYNDSWRNDGSTVPQQILSEGMD
jgi:hypothetical protein